MQYAKEAMQAEQEYRRQHPASGGEDTLPENRERVIRLLNDEFERQLKHHYEKQPEEKRASLEEQYKQQQSSNFDLAKPGDEQPQQETYEELYRRKLREPGRGDEPDRWKNDHER